MVFKQVVFSPLTTTIKEVFMSKNNTCDFQIGRLDGEKYVIMQNFQSMAEFWKRNNGGITVQYTLSFQKLDMPDKVICMAQMQRFCEKTLLREDGE
jgi:hypothetical protein